jgi:hypothetical protein
MQSLLSIGCTCYIIEMDLREIGWNDMGWSDLAEDRDQWRALVNTAMNVRIP